MKSKSFKVLPLILLVAVLVGCTTTSNSSPTTSSTNTSAAAESTESSTDTLEVSIKANNFSFTPSNIEAAPGQTVIIHLSSTGGPHDFVIDEFGAQSKLLSSGDTDTVTFTIPANAAGKTFEYYCSQGSHRQMGMFGTITVKSN